MSRRIDIELTSSRDDGSWTWRAAGAREPRGTLDSALVPGGAQVGDVLRAEIDGYLDRMSVVAILPPRAPRRQPERLELNSAGGDRPLVTTTLVRERSDERRPQGRRGDRRERGDRGDRRERGDRRDGPGRRERGERERGDRERGDREHGRADRDSRRQARARPDGRHERPERPAPPPVDAKPKPKRLRPGKAHRTALLEAVSPEQRPIAEQLLQGGIPSVRQAIEKQNQALRAEGKTEVKADQLLRVAEELRPRAAAAVWRDRAEAAIAAVDELDLRDLRSVVNAAGDAGRDEEARALAAQLREVLANRVEKEHAAWLADLVDTLNAGRVVRALRLSSRPPKAGSPIPGDLANQLVEGASAALTAETGQERWATVLDALAFSPIRRRVVPQSLPSKLSPELRTTVARLGTRLPEIAHIFAIEPEESAGRSQRGRAPGRAAPRGKKARTASQPAADADGGATSERPPKKARTESQPAADADGGATSERPPKKARTESQPAADADGGATSERPPKKARTESQPAADADGGATSEGSPNGDPDPAGTPQEATAQ